MTDTSAIHVSKYNGFRFSVRSATWRVHKEPGTETPSNVQRATRMTADTCGGPDSPNIESTHPAGVLPLAQLCGRHRQRVILGAVVGHKRVDVCVWHTSALAAARPEAVARKVPVRGIQAVQAVKVVHDLDTHTPANQFVDDARTPGTSTTTLSKPRLRWRYAAGFAQRR